MIQLLCFLSTLLALVSVSHIVQEIPNTYIFICVRIRNICTMLEKSSMIQPNRLCVVSTWGEGSRDSNASHPVLEPERHGPSNFKLKGNKFNLKLNGKQNCIKNMIEGRAMQINLLEKKRRKTYLGSKHQKKFHNLTLFFLSLFSHASVSSTYPCQSVRKLVF